MKFKTMLPGLFFLVLAVLVFIFADGYRRLYSGVFFAILGVFLLWNAKRMSR